MANCYIYFAVKKSLGLNGPRHRSKTHKYNNIAQSSHRYLFPALQNSSRTLNKSKHISIPIELASLVIFWPTKLL